MTAREAIGPLSIPKILASLGSAGAVVLVVGMFLYRQDDKGVVQDMLGEHDPQ